MLEIFGSYSAGDGSAVQKCNADRKWINSLAIDWANMAQASGLIWDARNSEVLASVIEKAYDSGARLSDPIPLFTGQNTVDNEQSVWKKPMIVLIDELAGSCGDIFPMADRQYDGIDSVQIVQRFKLDRVFSKRLRWICMWIVNCNLEPKAFELSNYADDL